MPTLEPGDTAKSETAEARLLKRIDLSRLPRHIAVIMDGNGRWANIRKLPRVAGHRAGVEAVREVIETSARLGVQVLTLYAFSLENWKRPRSEVRTLMALLKHYLRRELGTIHRHNIRFQTIGRIRDLAPAVQAALEAAVAKTRGNTGMILSVALNYSGRAELVDAFQRLADATRSNPHPEPVSESQLASYLYTNGLPDPDLLIRTSGEMRISNFLLWQIAYSEIYITPTLWPDFRRRHLLEAIIDYQRRHRRYGGIG